MIWEALREEEFEEAIEKSGGLCTGVFGGSCYVGKCVLYGHSRSRVFRDD